MRVRAVGGVGGAEGRLEALVELVLEQLGAHLLQAAGMLPRRAALRGAACPCASKGAKGRHRRVGGVRAVEPEEHVRTGEVVIGVEPPHGLEELRGEA